YGHEGLRSGGMGPNFEGFGSISDLFDAFFGGGLGGFGAASRTGPVQGGDLAVTTEGDLAQAAGGATVELSFEAVDTCERCHGNGAEPGTPITTCERCGGVGLLQAVSRPPLGQGGGAVPRDRCARGVGPGAARRPLAVRAGRAPGALRRLRRRWARGPAAVLALRRARARSAPPDPRRRRPR